MDHKMACTILEKANEYVASASKINDHVATMDHKIVCAILKKTNEYIASFASMNVFRI